MAYLKHMTLAFLTLLSLALPSFAQSDDPLVFATDHPSRILKAIKSKGSALI